MEKPKNKINWKNVLFDVLKITIGAVAAALGINL